LSKESNKTLKPEIKNKHTPDITLSKESNKTLKP